MLQFEILRNFEVLFIILTNFFSPTKIALLMNEKIANLKTKKFFSFSF